MNSTVLAGFGVAAAGAAVLCCAAPAAPAVDAEPASGPEPSAAKPAAAKPRKTRKRKQSPAPEPEPEPEPVVEMDVSNLPPVEFIAAPGADIASLSGTTLLMVSDPIPSMQCNRDTQPSRLLPQPVVSIGNAGQLAVDMLLASLTPGGVPRVGFLDCPHVLPIAGHDAFTGPPRKSKGKKKGKQGKQKDPTSNTPSVLSVNVEVYLDAPRGLTIVQVRAPVAPGRHREHTAMLAAWIKSVGFTRVVSLSTLPIHARREAQLATPEVMRGVQTSAVAADDSLVQPPLAVPLEPELRADPAIWRPRSSTVLLHDEAERRGVAQTTLLRFCEVMRALPIFRVSCICTMAFFDSI